MNAQQLSLRPRAQASSQHDSDIAQAAYTIALTVSPEECYRFWRQSENLARFMQHVESVTDTGNNRQHWVVKAPAGTTVEWDAEIVDDRPNELIAWRSVEGADVENEGSVHFEAAPGNRGTVLYVQLRYKPPGGMAGAMIAKLFGEEPQQQLKDDLRRFKQVLETGEIPRTDGQPSGPRSLKFKTLAEGRIS